MHRIKTYNALSSKGLKRFDPECFEVGEGIEYPTAILLRSHKLQEA
jgi:D-3-phosphoglycerate dehydrogenase